MVKPLSAASISRRMPTAGTLFLGIVIGLIVTKLFTSPASQSTSWRGGHANSLRANPMNSRYSRNAQLPTLTQRYRVLELIASLSAHHTKECLRAPQQEYAQQVHKRYEPLVGHKSYLTGRSWFGLGSKMVPDTSTPDLMDVKKRDSSLQARDVDPSAFQKPGWNEHKKRDLLSKQHKYFFAINLYNSFDVIPDLFATLFRTAGVLGYHNVFVSIYENGSNDQTKALLLIFDALARVVGMRIIIRTSMRTRGAFNHRIEYLAEVRNAAMVPLHELRDSRGEIFDTVIFMNDILPCVDDVLELIWQSRRQNAGITCAADYMFHDDIGAPVFYDNWVARDINGTALENAPFEQIFHHPESEKRFMKHLPVQVQSCWNGIAILDPAPFYNPPHVRFRMAKLSEGECSASECGLICNDYWNSGYGRIIMVPRVKLAYDQRVYDIIHPDRRNLTSIRGYKRIGGLPDDPHTDPQDKNWYGPHDRLFIPEEDEVLNFVPGPKYVWCWGWDGAGDLDGPDVDPIWEEQLPMTYDPESIIVKHDRRMPGW